MTTRGVALAPAVELALGAVLAGVAARVTHEAIGARLDELGAAAGADALDDLGRGGPTARTSMPSSFVVGSCNAAARGNDAAGGDGLERRVLAVAVVLAHEDDRAARRPWRS